MSTRVETYTGRLLDLSRPDPADVCIEDIAWQLSRIARFGGATTSEDVYSVAQHSVLVMNRVKQTANVIDKPILMTALLHDAHEAYMGDITRPMCNLLDLRAPIQRLKVRLQRAIWTGLLKDVKFDGQKFVPIESRHLDEADTWALRYEAYHLMHSKGRYLNAREHLDDEFILRNTLIWPSQYANESFLNHYNELLPASHRQ